MLGSISDIRRDYMLKSFDESHAADNPFDQFREWWDEATSADIDEVNAMTLATVDANGKPAARIVLLKGYTHEGFVFFTNYESAKGQDLAINPNAALLFFWKELERQIRIEGTVEKIDPADSDAYFHSRPAGSRIGAWVSPQSKVIPDRALLEVLDPEQNATFYDNYLELEYDLSKVLFIAAANSLQSIQPALRDRLEIIDLSGYAVEEKIEIAKRHLIPKQKELHGLKNTPIRFTDRLLEKIIQDYTRESGVRELDRQLASIMRYEARQLMLIS